MRPRAGRVLIWGGTVPMARSPIGWRRTGRSLSALPVDRSCVVVNPGRGRFTYSDGSCRRGRALSAANPYGDVAAGAAARQRRGAVVVGGSAETGPYHQVVQGVHGCRVRVVGQRRRVPRRLELGAQPRHVGGEPLRGARGKWS